MVVVPFRSPTLRNPNFSYSAIDGLSGSTLRLSRAKPSSRARSISAFNSLLP